MLPTPERLAKLREFGLSEYAARAYLALLELGATEARDVSRLAKVPLAKVYSTLEQLHEKGLVTVTPETPKKYEPVPFAEFVQRLRQAHAEQIRLLRDSQGELSAMFPIVGTRQVGDRGTTTTLRGRRTVLDKLRHCAEEAQNEILLVASDGFARRHHHARLMLQEARQRGIEARLLVNADADSIPRLAELVPYAQMRGKDTMKGAAPDVAIAVFDRRQALIVHFLPDDASSYHGKDVAILTGEEAIVRTMWAMLEHHWSKAPDVEGEIARATSPRADAEASRRQAREEEARAPAGLAHLGV